MILRFLWYIFWFMLYFYFTNEALQGCPEKHSGLWQWCLKSRMTEIIFLSHLPSHSSRQISQRCNSHLYQAQGMLVWIYGYDFQSISIVSIFNSDFNYCLFLRCLLKWLWQQWCRIYLVKQIRWKLVCICRNCAVWCPPEWVFSLPWAWHTYAVLR